MTMHPYPLDRTGPYVPAGSFSPGQALYRPSRPLQATYRLLLQAPYGSSQVFDQPLQASHKPLRLAGP
jgi:hypothetical protein